MGVKACWQLAVWQFWDAEVAHKDEEARIIHGEEFDSWFSPMHFDIDRSYCCAKYHNARPGMVVEHLKRAVPSYPPNTCRDVLDLTFNHLTADLMVLHLQRQCRFATTLAFYSSRRCRITIKNFDDLMDACLNVETLIVSDDKSDVFFGNATRLPPKCELVIVDASPLPPAHHLALLRRAHVRLQIRGESGKPWMPPVQL